MASVVAHSRSDPHLQGPLWGDGAWCASELAWMTLRLSAKFFSRAHTACG